MRGPSLGPVKAQLGPTLFHLKCKNLWWGLRCVSLGSRHLFSLCCETDAREEMEVKVALPFVGMKRASDAYFQDFWWILVAWSALWYSYSFIFELEMPILVLKTC
ncbi:hypothetical protein HS088_TW06G00798 [Tripterygium wilfordii]|uniref:Uncharacterized protein n=1 Tax=Tripterygium wilfordii TaxID=458696 RepID=A0A7J7DJX2_TRIWF|nr:hypothetical protein HS088_TW06G00798 [Tripterygium wilfordii]